MPAYLDTLPSMVDHPHETNGLSNGFYDHSDGLANNHTNGHTNGYTNGHSKSYAASKSKVLGFSNGSSKQTRRKPRRVIADEEEVYDVVVAGFGPAALSIAVAMEDALEEPEGEGVHDLPRKPRVAFLEKQHDFAWHPGMLLDGAKMQISFIKDMATLRNPRSKFTFLNYLHAKSRLVQFINLNTFLPSRMEFEDYLRWCARHFDDVVSYGEEVLDITPEVLGGNTAKVKGEVKKFAVRSKNVHTQKESIIKARHVIIAVGGKPIVPAPFDWKQPRIIHSSQYAQEIPYLLSNRIEKYNVAVIGGGQSAAEIFDNLHHNYPNCRTNLILRQAALKPSDDSPFVNEVFDAERIAPFYEQPAQWRMSTNIHNKNTNYGVVRLELLEKIYETLYTQRMSCASEDQWPHRILPNATVEAVTPLECKKVQLKFKWAPSSDPQAVEHREDMYDLIVLATGYSHSSHEDILEPLQRASEKADNQWVVGKDYRLQIDGLSVSPDAGIWLQGCNEQTHGLSDTLLSTLSVRGGELVKSIFQEDD